MPVPSSLVGVAVRPLSPLRWPLPAVFARELRACAAMALCVACFGLEPVLYVRAGAALSPLGFLAWSLVGAAALALAVSLPVVWRRSVAVAGVVRRGRGWMLLACLGMGYIPLFALAIPRLGPDIALIVVSVGPLVLMPVAIEWVPALWPLRRAGFAPLRLGLAAAVAVLGLFLCMAGRAGGFGAFWAGVGPAVAVGLGLCILASAGVASTILSNRVLAQRLVAVFGAGTPAWRLEGFAYALPVVPGAPLAMVASLAVPAELPPGGVWWGLANGAAIAAGALCFRIGVGLSRRHAVSLLYAATPVVGFGWLLAFGLFDVALVAWPLLAAGFAVVVAGLVLAMVPGRSRSVVGRPSPVTRSA